MLMNLPNFTLSLYGKLLASLMLAVMITSSTITSSTMAQEGTDKAVNSIQGAGGRIMQIAADSPDLEVSFHLTETTVNDDVLKHLPHAGNIIWLNLRGTKVSDAGLQNIGKLKNLKKLHLELTEVSDAGLKHLVNLDELEYLNLYGTSVSDAGLDDIAKLKKLKKVFLWQSKATDAGMDKLRAARPDLQVIGGAKLPVVETKTEEDEKAKAAKKEKENKK